MVENNKNVQRQKPVKKPKLPLTIEQKKQKEAESRRKRIATKFTKDVRAIFTNGGFQFIKSDTVEFVFRERTGEVDSVFIFENVVIVCEETLVKEVGDHLLKKKVLFDRIYENKAEFIQLLRNKLPAFNSYVENQIYDENQYEVRILYCSKTTIEQEHKLMCPNVNILESPLVKYFHNLSKITGKTSKYELFKFFNLEYSKIGDQRVKGSATSTKKYQGFLLPVANSNYPAGYRVLSFYVDPQALLHKSYVLRKDSWESPDSSYQRMLEPSKIKSMRKYLSEKKRVYVNNLIVTLPSTTEILSPDSKKILDEKELLENQHVVIQLPDEFNSIGLIDGQHRVYSYHEGNDEYETTIRKLRLCQNLLVTAIKYPDSVTDFERTKFEASLFLEINDKQTKTKSDLKQAIELIVNPFSTTAISKSIISKLNTRGPLAGLLEAHYFDDASKIKTSSIVSYGLKPLVKFIGQDSLMKVWDDPDKDKLATGGDKTLLDKYLNFCTSEINMLLSAARQNIGSEKWANNDSKTRIVTPTSINGLLICLREIIKAEVTGDMKYYTEKLKGIDKFDFSKHKSSNWNHMGIEIFNQFFKTELADKTEVDVP